MAIKKSDLYSSLWASCDELRGGMDASQYKDYVLTLLFVKYVSDKYAADPAALIEVPPGARFAAATTGASAGTSGVARRISAPSTTCRFITSNSAGVSTSALVRISSGVRTLPITTVAGAVSTHSSSRSGRRGPTPRVASARTSASSSSNTRSADAMPDWNTVTIDGKLSYLYFKRAEAYFADVI